MTHTHSQGRGRAAFTMIELLIVVAIIAVLVALMTGGVMRVLALGQRTEVSSDIMKMDQSLKIAMQKYNGITFLPSQLRLRNSMSTYNASDSLDRQTLGALRAMFGKRFTSSTATLNWGVPDGTVLDGAECLVFYLGGMIEGGRAVGFAADPQNPTAATTTTTGKERIGPFFEFKTNRLSVRSGRSAPSYLDPYGTAYAYFGPLSANNYVDTDAHMGVAPYFDPGPPKNYLNPNTFQIVSAGPNRAFGAGGSWNPKTGATDDATRDNLTNFSQSELGNEQQ